MAMSSMGAILILSVLVSLGAVGARESSSVDVMWPAVKHWEKRFPGVVLPTPLREAVSPVEGSVLAGLFATRIQHGSFSPSTSSSFCKAAGLICDDETLHSRLQQVLNKGVDTYEVAKGHAGGNPLRFSKYKSSKGESDSNPLPYWKYKSSKGESDNNPLPYWKYKSSKGESDSNPLPYWKYKSSKGEYDSNPLPYWKYKSSKVESYSNPLPYWKYKSSKGESDSNPLPYWTYKSSKVEYDSNPLPYWKYKSSKGESDSNPLPYWKYKSSKVESDSNPLPYWKYKSSKGESDSNPLPYWKYKSSKGESDSNPLSYWKYKSSKVESDSNPLPYWTYKSSKVESDSNPLPYWKYKSSKGESDSNPLPYWKYKSSKVEYDSNPLPYWKYKSSKGESDSNPLPYWKYKDAEGAADINFIQSDDKRPEVNQHNKSPIIKGFFMESDLAIGATVTLFDRPLIPPKPFVPKVVEDALLPIVPENLHKLQQIFNIEEGTEMYDAVAVATRHCGLNGEMVDEKFICALSLESFADFMSSNVGPDIKVLTNTPRDSYSVEGPMRVANFTTYDSVEDRINVAVCHILKFPSLMHMCHVTPDVKVVEAILTSDDGVKIRATGMCHLDTKMWQPNYVAFRLLGTKPGTPVCHWSYGQDLLVYATKTEESSVIHKAVAHGGHMAMAPIPVRDVMGM